MGDVYDEKNPSENAGISEEQEPTEDTADSDAQETAEEEVSEELEELPYVAAVNSVSAAEAPDYIGLINTANQWQIVAEQYSGNANTNKVPYDTDGDGVADVLIQKNVVPTGNENEFLVYLSITKQMTWDTLLAQSQLGLTTQGKWKESDVGSLVNTGSIGGNKSNILQPGMGQRNYQATIYLTRGGKTVHTFTGWYNGTTPNASNCTGYIILKGLENKAIIASIQVNLHNDGTGQRFGKLVATRRLEEKIGTSYAWLCQCDCGNQIKVSTNALLSAPGTRSCGCGRVDAVMQTIDKHGAIAEHCHFVDGTCIEKITSKRLQRNNVSGYTGVQIRGSRYIAIITFKHKVYYLGSFSNIEDAVHARKCAEDKLFGGFLDWYYSAKPSDKFSTITGVQKDP